MASPIDRGEEAGEAVVKGTTTYRHAVAILAAAAMRQLLPSARGQKPDIWAAPRTCNAK
jgi:hypothetical protein